MGTLADFRKQNPAYDDMNDADLASALHSKFYADLPREQFDAKLGIVPSPETHGADWKDAKGPKLQAYEPTLRDRIASALLPDERSPYARRVLEPILGSVGLGGTGGLNVVDFTPARIPLLAQEAARSASDGNYGQAALEAVGALPIPLLNKAIEGGVGAVRAAGSKVLPSKAADAAADLAQEGVAIPRTAEGGVTGIAGQALKEVPGVGFGNPVRNASEKGVADFDAAVAARIDELGTNYGTPAVARERAIADVLAGRTNASAAADEGLRAVREADGAATAQPVAPAFKGDVQQIVTPDQSMTVGARPQLVELDDLRLADGQFQPRDRSRAEYVDEARQRAVRLDPEQLKPGRVSDSGAPIVLDDGTIISGNGRALSISEVYADPALKARADAYRASLGPEAASMKRPVLVMRAEGLAGEDAARFADLSNRGRIAQMSATERASRDASAMGADLIHLYQGGAFDSPANQQFMHAFTNKAVNAGERAAFSKEGRLTQEGAGRMRNAVLAYAYPDAPLLSRLVESTDDNVRNITGALGDAAPRMAALREDIRAGLTPKEMDATPQLINAVKLIADLRSRNISPASHFAQQDAFAEADPFVEQWVRAFYNEDLSRPISREKMRAVLEAYADEAGKHSPYGLLPDTTTKGDVLNVAKRANPSAEAGEGGAQSLGASVREGGEQVQRSEVAVGGAPAGPGGEVAGKAADVKPVALAPKMTEQEAKLDVIGRAIGIDATKLDPDTVAARLVEMANSNLSADVSGLLKVKTVLGPEAWGDVVHGLTARMGADKGKFDVTKFLTEYSAMTENGRNVLFSGAGREGVKASLDRLAKHLPVRERMADMTDSTLSGIPVVGRYLERGASVVGLVMHPMTAFTSALGQLSALAAAKVIARPAVARDAARWAEVVTAASPATKAMVALVTRNLAASIAKETGDDEREIEANLKGTN